MVLLPKVDWCQRLHIIVLYEIRAVARALIMVGRRNVYCHLDSHTYMISRSFRFAQVFKHELVRLLRKDMQRVFPV